MANELFDLEIEEVSLVDQPANPGAKVVFWKRDDSLPGKESQVAEKNLDPQPNDNDKVVKSLKEAHETELKKRDEQITELKKMAEEAKAKAETFQKSLDAANEALAAISKRDQIASLEAELKSGGVPEAVAKARAEMLFGLPEEAREAVKKSFLDDAKALRESALFKRHGSSQATDTTDNSIEAQVSKKARERQVEKGGTYEQSYAAVVKTLSAEDREALYSREAN